MGQDQSRAKACQLGQAETGGTDRSVSAGSASAAPWEAPVSLAGVEGFQVVRLLPDSPAHKAGLIPFFDIVTALDKVLLESEGKAALSFFKSYVANHRDQPVCFTTFNLYSRTYRDVYCVPSDEWGGGGLLGCSIEWTRADACPERCVHVVDVLEGSPAACSTELQANRDYIIGMQTVQETLITLIKSQKDFYCRLEAWHEEQRWALERKQFFPNERVEVPHVLLFLVYNSESNTIEEVEVEMGTNPEAAVGISVATGLLHIIPSVATADLAVGASLPVMSKFASVGHSVVTPTRAQQQEHQLLQDVSLTPAVGAAPQPREQSQESTGSAQPLPSLPLPQEAHARCAVVDSPEVHTMTNPHEPPMNSCPQPCPPRPQLQQQLTEAALYSMPSLASFNVAPPPRHDAAGGTAAAAVEMGQKPFNPFAEEASPDYDVLEGAPLAHEGVMAAEHHLGQHAPTMEQPYSSSYPPLSSQSPPLSGSLPAQMNGSHNPATALPSYSAPPPPPQQLHVTTMPTFSSQRMPPPLQFPVFPGAAAAKRAPA
ncbi:putative Golgi reassembly stacking protein [Leishmania major strain Friedlin]|uniref:Putative Golgi reassembly stacking protein n=1 Tax=Leishmania major TaxID=5664 RepID=Q4Q3U9_LEIMA|nr:putative Golgi reassembly stacking protein [Leishmania major strain Friedlin]CAG9580862.1 Golgi_reassembly_stacking_protein_(GRASP_homologue)_-_putative [Leishmania major strain Friedlin]CAJ06649.1 putative Golgi reassembly stacking protein [Leishmania major strain Friedlin]|eukprot:XP_001685999.1 putative Golgi reassembly stacking protein [Leishmania major strain Friedlin]